MWKTLNHPNVLPLLGVMMTKGRFAMVSKWMTNGNINQFVRVHQDMNRFKLVSSLFKFLRSSIVVDGCAPPIVERRRQGLDIYAQSGDDPRRSQGGAS